jgi:hypothetical protein
VYKQILIDAKLKTGKRGQNVLGEDTLLFSERDILDKITDYVLPLYDGDLETEAFIAPRRQK